MEISGRNLPDRNVGKIKGRNDLSACGLVRDREIVELSGRSLASANLSDHGKSICCTVTYEED